MHLLSLSELRVSMYRSAFWPYLLAKEKGMLAFQVRAEGTKRKMCMFE